jgi:oligoendopeptidase F
MFKKKQHILSKDQEELLTKISGICGQSEIFSTLTNTEIKFEDALDSKNNKHKILTPSDAYRYLNSDDRVLRKNT